MSKGLIRHAVIIAVLAGTLLAGYATNERTPSELTRPLSSIAQQIGCWQGNDNPPLGEETLSVLKASSYLSRTYRCDDKGLNLFIAYYSLQQAGESMHSPKNCLPGSGWEIWKYEELETAAPNGEPVPINKFYLQHGRDRAIAFYWYQSRSRIIANEYLGKVCLVWDTILAGNTEGSIVRVIIPDDSASEAVVSDFIPQVMGEVANVMPGESRFRP